MTQWCWAKRVILGLAVFAGASAFHSRAEARKFDFKSESLATYFRGTFGSSQLSDSAYGSSSGTDVTVDKKVATNASGEIGLLFSGEKLVFRLGAELLIPKHYTDIKGTNVAGTELFNLDSKILALIPMVNIEFLAFRNSISRMLVGVGAGMAFVTLDNTYQMTPEGTAALGVTDFTESAATRTFMAQTYLGYEILLTDTVTVEADVGYRYLNVRSIESTKATTAISGTQAETDYLKNMDTSNRSLDLGGAFVGLGLRFYIGL